MKLFLKNLHSQVVKREDVLVDRLTDSQRLVWMRIPVFSGVIRGKKSQHRRHNGIHVQGLNGLNVQILFIGLNRKMPPHLVNSAKNTNFRTKNLYSNGQ